jgi:hypothetical protein
MEIAVDMSEYSWRCGNWQHGNCRSVDLAAKDSIAGDMEIAADVS